MVFVFCGEREEQEDVLISRLYFSNDATVVMPVQWDMNGDIWDDVVTSANEYDYAEPPVVGDFSSRVNTRWPLTLYEVCGAVAYYFTILAVRVAKFSE